MIIFSSDYLQAVNLDSITAIYVTRNGGVKVNFKDGTGCQLGSYLSEDDAKRALKMIKEPIRLGHPTYTMPTLEQLKDIDKAPIVIPVNGRKQKRHGGS